MRNIEDYLSALTVIYNKQLHYDLIEGSATPEGTARYFSQTSLSYPQYREDSWICHPARMNFSMARIGFGTYRIHKKNKLHEDALREAVLSGINVIDTASNFSDGDSESATGDAIRLLMSGKRIARDEVVIMTKAGILQGRILSFIRNNPSLQENLIPLSSNAAFSIAPEMIRLQVELSLLRLGLKTIDIFLLQNVEELYYSLLRDYPEKEALSKFYYQIHLAFETLEELRFEKKISFIGIASNALRDTETGISLENFLALAPDNFSAIQFPANILESEILESTSANLASGAGLYAIAGRPLNATSHKGLIRLACMTPEPNIIAESIEMDRLIADLLYAEGKIIELFSKRRFRFNEKLPSLSVILDQYRHALQTPDHLQKHKKEMLSIINEGIKQLKILSEKKEEAYAVEAYARLCGAIFSRLDIMSRINDHERMLSLQKRLQNISHDISDLAMLAIRALLAFDVPDTVLCGMRNISYVRQLCTNFRLPGMSQDTAKAIIQETKKWVVE